MGKDDQNIGQSDTHQQKLRSLKRVNIESLKEFTSELSLNPDLLFSSELAFFRDALSKYGELRPIHYPSLVDSIAHKVENGSLEELCTISRDACEAVTPLIKGTINIKIYLHC